MTIKSGDYVVRVGGADGSDIAAEFALAATDDYVIPAQTADGESVACALDPLSTNAEFGIAARTSDGLDAGLKIGSFAPASIWCLTSSGRLQWVYDTGADTRGVRADDSTLYVAGGPGDIWRLTKADRTTLWTFDTGAAGMGIWPVNSYVYVAGASDAGPNADQAWKLNTNDGSLIWAYPTAGGGWGKRGMAIHAYGNGNPHLGANRSVTNGQTSTVFKLDTDGNLTWRKFLNIARAIRVDSLGNVFVAHERYVGAIATKFDSFGAVQWRFPAPADAGGYGLDLDPSGNVYVSGFSASAPASLWKLDPDGNSTWSWNTGAIAWGVSLADDGSIYLVGDSSDGATVWKLTGGAEEWSYNTGSRAYAVHPHGDDVFVAGIRVAA